VTIPVPDYMSRFYDALLNATTDAQVDALVQDYDPPPEHAEEDRWRAESQGEERKKQLRGLSSALDWRMDGTRSTAEIDLAFRRTEERDRQCSAGQGIREGRLVP